MRVKCGTGLLRISISRITIFFLQPIGFAKENNIAALNLIEKMRLGDNLKILSYQTILKTQTYLIIARTVGEEKANFLIKEEIEKASQKYQQQWNKNLAAAYAEFFTSGELVFLANEHKSSLYVKKLFKSQDQVGASMQSKSLDLLHSLNVDVLSNAFEKITPKNE